MNIGKLNLNNRAILAPMVEVTDAPLRQICREYGAGLTFTQMISAKGIFENSFYSLKALAFNRSEKPIAIQLIANEPDYLKRAIKEVKSLQPDLIDLNCGCSVPQVCKFGLGAAILDDPILLAKLVKSMVESAGDIPVSIKIRLGRDKNNITVMRNAKIIEENGASLMNIHARTRNQSYLELPDWSWIKRVKEEVNIPVMGNGNLFEPEDCINLINETGCDFVFIARGALGNPFIFKRFNALLETGVDPGPPTVDEVGTVALRHLKLNIKDSGEELGIKKARKNLIWYFRFYNGITHLINTIFTIDNAASVEQFILDHIEKIRNNNYPEENFDKITKSFNERVLFWLNNNQPVETVN